MSGYRGEVRVFGLIGAALLVCAVLYGGLSSAQANGEILGVKIAVAGPAAMFVILILIFAWQGLLTFEISRKLELVDRPIEKWTEEEAHRAIDDLRSEVNALTRRRQKIEEYLARVLRGDLTHEAMEAIGMRPAERGGHKR